jgi:hypothetical protein
MVRTRRAMARVIREGSLTEPADDSELHSISPADRIAMMWPLARDAWAMAAAGRASPSTAWADVASRLPRQIVTVQRRGR